MSVQSVSASYLLTPIGSPVDKIAYAVEAARVEQRTDLDKLVIDMETNKNFQNLRSNPSCSYYSSFEQLDAFVDLRDVMYLRSSEEKPELIPSYYVL